MSKILILGGTGAIGTYLIEELKNTSHEVYITSRSAHDDVQNIRYIQGNAKDDSFIAEILGQDFDCVVDFMSYKTPDFSARYQEFLAKTKQYIFLSSYRVYADSDMQPLKETSPRLLDVSNNAEYLATDEYALAKARQEDLLHASGYNNYTIVRPSITFSKQRFQLGTLEADVIIPNALHHRPVVLPKDMLSKYAAISWAGDVAKMIKTLILNAVAYGEVYNVCSAERHTWQEIAAFYKQYIGVSVKPVDLDIFLKTVARGGEYQVLYDRMFNRIMDNSKILQLMQADANSLSPLEKALSTELENVKKTAHLIKTNRKISKKIKRARLKMFIRQCINFIKMKEGLWQKKK